MSKELVIRELPRCESIIRHVKGQQNVISELILFLNPFRNPSYSLEFTESRKGSFICFI